MLRHPDRYTRRVLRLALRAIGFADVRSGILPPQSGSVCDETTTGPGMTKGA